MYALELVKKHPYAVGGATLVSVIVAIYFFGGGGGGSSGSVMTLQSTTPPTDPNTVAAASAAQLANIAAQAQTAQVNADKEISLKMLEAANTKALYEKDTAFHIADLAAAQNSRDAANVKLANILAYKNRVQQITAAAIAAERLRQSQVALAKKNQQAVKK